MSTERIDIQITETGARRVKRSIEEIGEGASGAERALSLLKRALGALGLAAFARSVLATADAWTNMQNQLRLVTDSTAELGVVTDELFNISQRSRAALDSTASAYVKVARQADQLGLSQNEVLQFSESLNQAIALSGSSAQEASAGIRQLGQAIGSGALRGDELNSVLENTSEVAMVIARGMDVPIGQLRKLGAEGKITAQDIIRSFQEARVELSERFGKTVPTLGQAIQVLDNAWTRFIGNLNESTGVTGLLARGLVWVSENLEELARWAAVAGTTIVTVLVARAIPLLIARLGQLAAVIAANPFGAIAIAITAATAALVAFSDRISITEDGMVTLADAGVYAWNQIKKGLETLYNFLADVFRDFVTWTNETFNTMIDISLGFPRMFARGLDDLLKGFKGFAGAIVAVWNQAKANLAGHTGVTLMDALLSGFDQGVKSVGDTGPVEKLLDNLINGARMVANSRIERAAAEENARRRAKEAMDESSVATVTVPTEKGPTFSELLGNLKREGDLLRVNADLREKAATIMQFEEALKRQLTQDEAQQVVAITSTNQALQMRADVLDNISQPAQDFIEQSKALNDVMVQTPALTEQVQQALAELELQFLNMQQGGSFADGYVRQMRIMQLETRNAVADMGAEFASIFGPGGSLSRGIGDAIAQSIVFGDRLDQAMKKVAETVLTQVISSLVQLGINMALNAALGNGLSTAATAASVAQAAAVAAAWATPAALVNAATFGAGAAAGTTALTTSIASIKGLSLLSGFAEGGYTGDIGRSKVAGVVHGNEYVFDAASTSRLGVRNLDRMREGHGMFGAAPTMNIKVVNQNIPGAEFQVNQLSHNDVEIIARRVVNQEAPNVIAADMQNPSGKTRRAVVGNTTAQNKR